jgi:hypothetical protein
MKRYTVIIDGKEEMFDVYPDRYDAFIAQYPEAVLIEETKKETEDFQTDTAADVDVVSEKVTLNTDSASENGSLELTETFKPESEEQQRVDKAMADIRAIEITPELEAEWEAEVNAGPTRETSGETFDEMGIKALATEVVTSMPYDDKVKEARTMLAKNQKVSESEVPLDDIIKLAKNLTVKEKRQDWLATKREEAFERYEEDVVDYTDIFSFNGIDNYYKKGLKLLTGVNLETNQEEEYRLGRKQMTSRFNNEFLEKEKEIDNRSKSIDENVALMDIAKLKIQELDTKYINTPNEVTAEEINEYKNLVETYKTAYGSAMSASNGLSEMVTDSDDIEVLADMAKRTYNNVDVATNRFKSAALDLAGGLGVLGSEINVQAVLKRTGVLDDENVGELPVFMQNWYKAGDEVNKGIKAGSKKLHEVANEITGATKNRQELSKIEGLEDFGEFMLDLLTEQAVNTAITVGTGGAGLLILAGGAAGNKMNEMNEEILEGENISPAQFYAAGLLYGAAEYVTEKVSLGQALRGLNAMGLPVKNFTKAFDLGSAGLRGGMTFSRAFGRWAKGINQEGMAELGAQLSNNLVDNYLLGKDVAITDGLSEAYITGGLMSGLGFGAPVIATDIAKAFINDGLQTKINNNSLKIIKLSKDQEKIQSQSLGVFNKEAAEAYNLLQKQKEALLYENLTNMKQVESTIDALDSTDKQRLLDLSTDSYNLRAENEKLNKNTMIPKEALKDLIEANTAKIQSNNNQRELILNNTLYSKDKATADKLAAEFIAKNNLGDSILYIDGKTTDEVADQMKTEADRAAAAKEITPEQYTKLKADIQAFKEAKGAEGVYVGQDVGIPMVATVEDVALGVETPFMPGQYNGAVKRHEVGHAILFSKFLTGNPAAYKLVEQFEKYMINNYKGAAERFAAVDANYPLGKFTKNQILEEKLATMLEYVSKTNISMDKTFSNKVMNIFKGDKDFSKLESVKDAEGVLGMLQSFARILDKGDLTGEELAAKVVKGEVVGTTTADVDAAADTQAKGPTFSLRAQLNKFETALEKIEEDYDNNILDYDDYEQKRDLQEERIAAVKKKIESIGESEIVSKPKKKKESTADQKEQNAEVDALVGEKDAEGNYVSTKKEWLKDGVAKAYNAIVKGNLIDGLIVKGIVGDTVQGKSVAEFVQEVKESLTPLLMRFNPEINNSLIGFINSQLRFRKGDALKKLRKSKTENIDSGTREMNAIENKADKTSKETRQEPIGNLLKATSLISQATRSKLAEDLKKWAISNKIDFDNFRFSMVDTTLAITDELGNPVFQELKGKQVVESLLDDAMREIFPNVSPDKILDTRKMFTGKEASAMHKAFIADVVDADSIIKSSDSDNLAGIFIKILPKGAVAADGKNKALAKDVNTNKATALDPSILQNFYVKSGNAIGKTGLQEYVLKDNIRYSDVYAAFGMDSAGNKTTYNRSGNTRSVLAASGRLLGQLMMNEVIRTDLGLTTEQQLNTAAGKSDAMFSLKIENSLSAIKVDVNVKLTEKNIEMTRELFVSLSQELGAEDTVKYLVPLISRGYGTWMTKLGIKSFIPGRFSLFKNREDFFKTIGMEEFKNFKSGDRAVSITVINKEGKPTLKNINLKIDFDQNAKKLNKWINSIKDRQDFAKDQQKGLLKISNFLMDSLANDGSQENKNAVATFLQSMNSNVNGLIRTAAVPKYMFLVTGNLDYVYEHSKTASDTLVELAALIFSKDKSKLNKEFGNIMEDFVVSIIPKKYDSLLGKVSRANGPREGGSKSNYAKPLIKAINGIPARYVMPEFINKLIKKGLSPMNLVEINNNSLKNHLNAVKTDKKIIKENNANLSKSIRQKDQSMNEVMESMIASDKALTIANSLDVPSKGISVWDFDDTLARSKSNVLYTMPDGSKGKLTAEQFAKDGDRLMAEGAVYDFSEFSEVVQGSKGPFFEKAMARNKKFGNKNVYILTARPANSATAIHKFLKGIGLDIPLANITGLANSSPEAKANWVVGKAAEGYNDFYFADDAKGNVKAVDKALGKIGVKKKVELADPTNNTYSFKKQPKAVQDVLKTIDIKSQVQQDRLKASKELDDAFNNYLEGSTGIEAYKRYKKDKAMLKGRGKGRFDYFIPPGAEDFVGLLYKTLQKGKKGEQQFAFYKKYLIDPYTKAMSGLIKARTAIGKDFIALKKELGIVPKSLKKTFKVKDENGNMKDSLFTKEQAIRTYIWNAQGIEMPNLSQVDLAILVNYVNADAKLKTFANKLLSFNKGLDSKPPSQNWLSGSIATDLQANLNSVGRKQLLEVWTQNKDAIFSEENINKLEAAYGADYVDAVRDILRRMTTGRSTLPASGSKDWDAIVKWLNAAVGNIMSFNVRSASLQLLSITNFIDMEDNNIIAAGKAFANQRQYWKDVVMLLNSDYLVDRRDGTRINVNEADIALAAKEGGPQAVLNKILEVGFLPTKIADSFAIAVGGSTFYRTKVKALVKGGMNEVAAEKQAMLDFMARSEESQQSSEQSKISRQQAGPVGKLILAFGNTSAQYARIIKKSALDLKNGRGNPRTHIARITYYGAMQNFVFNFLQQALFKLSFGDEEEEEEADGKKIKMANSMIDSLLRGMGWQAAALAAVKNTALKLYERNDKKVNNDFGDKAVASLLSISPPLSSKISKIARIGNIYEWEMKKKERGIFDDPFSLDSPQLAIGATLIAAATSLPTDRALSKAINLVDVFKEDTENWQRPWIAAGWPKWSLQTDAQNAEDRKKTSKAKLSPKQVRKQELKNKGGEAIKDMLRTYGFTELEIQKLKGQPNEINAIIKFQDEVVKK